MLGRHALIISLLVLAVLAGLVAYAITSTPFSAMWFGMGEGNPAYAQKWHDRLQPLADPDAAAALYPEVEVLWFANGEWVIGVSDDSHASHWGGTVVVRDSAGQVHAYFGHVCGPRFLSRASDANSLAAFYAHKAWRYGNMQEHTFP
jgi:hypothetical protein